MELRRFIRDYAATIVAGVLVCALVVVLSLRSCGAMGEGRYAIVHFEDGSTAAYDLHEDQTIEVSSNLGSNTLQIEDGTVRMIEADCPNENCLHQQAISRPGEQIICLPHKVWIEVSADEVTSSSAELDTSAVSWEDGYDGATLSADGVDVVAS